MFKIFSKQKMLAEQVPDVRLVNDSTIRSGNNVNFNVHRASGGYVIECNNYDRKNDRDCRSLHIITDDKDLGQELGKIITVELLRI